MTIQFVSGGTQMSPTALTRDSCRTIVQVNATVNEWFQLPTGCLPGDVFEIYSTDPNYAPVALPPSGESFIKTGTGASGANGNSVLIFRKLTSTVWGNLIT